MIRLVEVTQTALGYSKELCTMGYMTNVLTRRLVDNQWPLVDSCWLLGSSGQVLGASWYPLASPPGRFLLEVRWTQQASPPPYLSGTSWTQQALIYSGLVGTHWLVPPAGSSLRLVGPNKPPLPPIYQELAGPS